MTLTQKQINDAKNALQQIPCEEQYLFTNYRALQELHAEKSAAALIAMTHQNGGDPLNPGPATGSLFAICKGPLVGEAAVIGGILAQLEARPGFADSIAKVQAAVDEIRRLEAIDAADRATIGEAQGRLQALEQKLKDDAAMRLANDPALAKLREDIAEAEYRLSESTPLQDPDDAERRRKASEALAPIRRKGEKLAVELLASE